MKNFNQFNESAETRISQKKYANTVQAHKAGKHVHNVYQNDGHVINQHGSQGGSLKTVEKRYHEKSGKTTYHSLK